MAQAPSTIVTTIDFNLYMVCKKTLEQKYRDYSNWLKECCEELESPIPYACDEVRLKTPRAKKRHISLNKSAAKQAKYAAGIRSTKKRKTSILSPSVRNSVVKSKKTKVTRGNEMLNPAVVVTDAPEMSNRRMTRAMRQTLAKAGNDSRELLKPSPKVVVERLSAEEIEKQTKARRSLFLKPKVAAENKENNSQSANADNSGAETEWMTDDEEVYYDADAASSPKAGPKSNKDNFKETKIPVAYNKHLASVTTPKSSRVTRMSTRKLKDLNTPINASVNSNRKMSTKSRICTRTMARNRQASTDSNTSLDSNIPRAAASVKSTPSQTKTLKGLTLSAQKRTRAPGSAIKDLTLSAQKRREEIERKRRQIIEENMLKEREVNERKEKLLQQKILEHKEKQSQREKRAAELREQQLRAKEEQRLKMQRKKEEELERRRKERELQKKVEMEQRQKALAAKQLEVEQKKLQEERERQEALRRKKEQQEREKQEKDRLNALIQQHNSSLQQKALANSFLKKAAAYEPISVAPTVVVENVESTSKALKETNTLNENQNNTFVMNTTKTIAKEFSNYEITPPPKPIKKPPNPENYDISTVQSDDETDDENQPQKQIPKWAKGNEFLLALELQFRKPSELREEEMRKIFPPVKLPVDLGDIFRGNVSVANKYSKRTSSAVWETAPFL